MIFSEQNSPSLINVKYDSSLQEAPYEVEVDREKYTEFLIHFGLPEEKITKRTLTIKRNPAHCFYPREFGAECGAISKDITLFTDRILRSLFTANSSEYFDDRLRSQYGTILLRSTLMHESRHLIDFHYPKCYMPFYAWKVLQMGSSLVGGIKLGEIAAQGIHDIFGLPNLPTLLQFAVFYYIGSKKFWYLGDPLEKRAMAFDSENVNDPYWKDIITLKSIGNLNQPSSLNL